MEDFFAKQEKTPDIDSMSCTVSSRYRLYLSTPGQDIFRDNAFFSLGDSRVHNFGTSGYSHAREWTRQYTFVFFHASHYPGYEIFRSNKHSRLFP